MLLIACTRIAPAIASTNTHGTNVPCCAHANAVPTNTGTAAIGKVFGRSATRQAASEPGSTAAIEGVLISGPHPSRRPLPDSPGGARRVHAFVHPPHGFGTRSATGRVYSRGGSRQ